MHVQSADIARLSTIDAHAGGQSLRLVVDGMPSPDGSTAAEKARWLARHRDRYRSFVALEPRGHLDLTAAVLVEPAAPDAQAGVVFMDAGGYPPMSGHGLIAATTIAIERGLLVLSSPGPELDLRIDTPAGLVAARARLDSGGDRLRVASVAVRHGPAFVHDAGRTVEVGRRRLRVDVACCGTFFALCDAETTGVPLDAAHLPALRALGVEICAALDRAGAPVHPLDPTVDGVAAVVFTGIPADGGAHLTSLTVAQHGAVDRSSCGVGGAAVMAVLSAMGLLGEGDPFLQQGLAGCVSHGRIVERTTVGEADAVIAEIEGTAWIVGEHVWIAGADDPFRDGRAAPREV